MTERELSIIAAGKIEAIPTGYTLMIPTHELTGSVSPLEGGLVAIRYSV